MTTLTPYRATAFDRGSGRAAFDRRFPSALAYGAAVMPALVQTPALRIIDRELTAVQDGTCSRLLITMPPQEGKSTLATRFFVGWSLTCNPYARWGIASYADRLAGNWSRRIRNDIIGSGRGAYDLGIRLGRDQKASDEWRLANGVGGVYAGGIGSSWSGTPLDGLVIDDPHKDRKAVDSLVQRDDVWDWYPTGTARLSPGGPVILILTRWHWDDLAGRLLRDQPGVWRVIHIPAQADPTIQSPDILGRAPGEYMESSRRRTREGWEIRKRDAGAEWTPLYQGAPASPGGDTFDVDRLRYWHPSADGTALVCGPRTWPIRDCYRFVTIDTATSTRTTADYTVASAWAIAPDASTILLDVARDRVPEHRQIGLARPLLERWAPDCTWIESSLRGTKLVRAAAAEGWHLDDLKADKSKGVRAAPAAIRVGQGMVWFPAQHEHLEIIVEEMRQFPNGRHDDFVDTLAYAEAVRMMRFVPPGAHNTDTPSPVRDVYAVATDGEPLDYDRAAW